MSAVERTSRIRTHVKRILALRGTGAIPADRPDVSDAYRLLLGQVQT